jgi:hypothetical protein
MVQPVICRLISSCQVVERMPSCLSPRCEYCLEHYQVIPIWFFLELCMTPGWLRSTAILNMLT